MAVEDVAAARIQADDGAADRGVLEHEPPQRVPRRRVVGAAGGIHAGATPGFASATVWIDSGSAEFRSNIAPASTPARAIAAADRSLG